MRYLFLTTTYPGLSNKGYGLGTAISHTASALAAKGHEVHVLCATGRRHTSELAGVICHEFVCGGIRHGTANPYSARAHQLYMNSDLHLAEIYQYWCEYVDIVNGGFRPDIIDAPDYRALGYFFVQHRLLGYPEAFAPVLASCHANQFMTVDLNCDLASSWSNLLLRQREKYQLLGADDRLAVSRFMAGHIEARYHLPEPHVYYTCSPHARMENLQTPCENDELLFFGQFRYLKGLLQLLRVCAVLWNEGQTFVLKLLGDSQWYAAKEMDMAAYIRREYGDYIARGMLRIFPHTGDFGTIKGMLSQSRAVVHPSLMESLSHSCIEAMSFGRPVIASDRGGHTELVQHEVSGFIYSDDRGLETALKRVLGASRTELETWGRNANRRICELVSVENALPQYERICQETIARAGAEKRSLFPGVAFADKRRFAVMPAPESTGGAGERVADLLHVIIPCFNHGRFLNDVIESVRDSTYRPIRLTIIDDGSTEARTQMELAALEKQFSSGDGMEIRWFREPRNIGPAAVRTRWGQSTNAEFICFVDADDKVRPGYFARAIAVLRKYGNVGFVGGWIDGFGKRSFSWIITDVDLPLFLLRNQAMGPSVIRRCAWQGQTLPTVGEDHDGYLAMVEKGWLGVNLPETVYDYRIKRGSFYHAATANEFRLMMTSIARRHERLYRIFGDEIFAILAQNHLFGPPRANGRLARLKSVKACQIRSTISFVLARRRGIWKLPLALLRLLLPDRSGR